MEARIVPTSIAVQHLVNGVKALVLMDGKGSKVTVEFPLGKAGIKVMADIVEELWWLVLEEAGVTEDATDD